MTVNPCGRCGWAVQPDRQAPGFWVDQWNGRHCGGDPRYPHYTAVAKKSNTALIVVGCVGGVVILAAAAALVAVVTRGADGPIAAPAERSSSGIPTAEAGAPPSADARSGEEPAKPRDPEAPVPCEERSRVMHCFPVSGPELVARIKKTPKWRCHKAGEKDDSGRTLREPECRTRNQTNTRSASIQYAAYPRGDGSKMEGVRISGAARALNGAVTAQDATKVSTEVFEMAVTHLWPDDTALQREARKALAGLRKKECRPAVEPETVKLSAGYEISCMTWKPITVKHNDGQVVTTISDSVRISVPLDYGWD